MKNLLIIMGMVVAVAGSYLATSETEPMRWRSGRAPSPEFKWRQVARDGAGEYPQHQQKDKYPVGVMPVVAFNGGLWMTAQTMAWSSADGIHWKGHVKNDWGERISSAHVFFKNKLWMYGGMRMSREFTNEAWSSTDGKSWTLVGAPMAWPARKGHHLVEFKDKLWMFGGSTSVAEDLTPNRFLNDVWMSEDGLTWTPVTAAAPWAAREYPNVVVFKNALWLLGGQGHSDIWHSTDGRKWTQIATESPWKDRFDFGALVYDNLLWVFGGRALDPYVSLNDVWFSPDGINWINQTNNAPWSVRSASHSVVFQNKLWIFSGKHKANRRISDIWTMEPLKQKTK